jgi:hypothetical protein
MFSLIRDLGFRAAAKQEAVPFVIAARTTQSIDALT